MTEAESPPTPCERCGKEHPACRAHNRTGKACKYPRVEGAPTCRFHGSRAPQVLAAVQRRLVESEVAELVATTVGARLVSLGGVEANRENVSYTETLLDLISQSTVAVGVLGSLVGQYDEVTTLEVAGELAVREVVRPELTLWNEERRFLAELCSKAARLNIDERRLRLDQAKGERVVEAVLAALADPEWSLSAEQQATGKRVIARHFREMTAG